MERLDRRTLLRRGAQWSLAAGAVGLVGCGAPERWTWRPQAAPLDLGVTHTQDSLDGDRAAVARAEDVLRGLGDAWQVHHLMGFGTLSPEPSPGVYRWETLDARMALTRRTGGRTVLTAAVAPDWMKGGLAGTTDWSTVEVAPLPQHVGDFADLVGRAVARYPQIEVVQVWNELKGFFDAASNTWDVAGYLRLYDAVAAAVRRTRPGVRIGGPYISMNLWDDADAGGFPSEVSGPWGVVDRRSLDVVDAWLAARPDADLLVVDGGTLTRDAGLATDPATAAEYFATVTSWLRARTALPVWWAEVYPSSPPAATAVATLEAVAALAEAGASAAMLWQPEAGDGFPFAALWTDTALGDGGRPTDLTATWRWLVPRLRAGGVSIGRTDDGALLGFRAADGTVLVNTTDEAQGSLPAFGTSLAAAGG